MIELKHITKVFHLQKGDIIACDDINLKIDDGVIFGVIGYLHCCYLYITFIKLKSQHFFTFHFLQLLKIYM